MHRRNAVHRLPIRTGTSLQPLGLYALQRNVPRDHQPNDRTEAAHALAREQQLTRRPSWGPPDMLLDRMPRLDRCPYSANLPLLVPWGACAVVACVMRTTIHFPLLVPKLPVVSRSGRSSTKSILPAPKDAVPGLLWRWPYALGGCTPATRVL